jgi:predicted alpha-1,2-mannosidase
VGNWAAALGKKQDQEELRRLSNAWQNLYDPELKLLRPKLANGQFISKFDPSQPWRGFQEGNAWQYTYFVPQDPEALIKKIGRETFNARLDSSFVLAEKAFFGGGADIDAFAGIAGIYNHGNQPNLHVAWMFNYSGLPSLTQKWVRSICDKFYGVEGIHGYGYGQDEDQGQLGAWYVMAAMGLFDVKGFTEPNAALGLGSPLFDTIHIRLNPAYARGKIFTIITKNNAAGNNYVQSIQLNGRKIHRPFIPLQNILDGGGLVLQMGASAVDKY